MSFREGNIDSRGDSDGASIHYFDWGGDGPPLVLLHATGFLAALWRPLAEPLAARFRVVAIDQRGHGDSAKPSNGYRFETFADDFQRVIEALELEAPLAAGHSAGGTTIVAHTDRYPGVVRRAVLIEPILPSPEWYSNPRPGRNSVSLADGARRRRAVWPGADEIVASYSTKPNFMTWREDVLRLYAEEGTRPREDGQVELKCPPEAEAKVFEAAQHIDPWPMLNKMPCPTLVLWGEKSHLHAFAMTDKVEEAIPDASTVVVPDTTHFLPQEQPEQVARIIEGFLADGSTDLAED